MLLNAAQSVPVSADQLVETQDNLLLAGSKITFKDIYNREMDIPLVKGKYYRAEEVDDVFILLNGVLTDISEQAFRQNKQVTQLQEDLQELRNRPVVEESVSESGLGVESSELQAKLDKREAEMKKILLKLRDVMAENARLSIENEEYGNLIDQLVAKIEVLEIRKA